ncbi:hypothetical protein C8J57DRAFT_1530860 [Mycena rebaudengoi]|nr:hypothetical protein C8J57DRAFT_1530860 [Mycena rebaudengoi]
MDAPKLIAHATMTTFAHFFGYTIAQPTLATEDGRYLFKNAPDALALTHGCLHVHRVVAHRLRARSPRRGPRPVHIDKTVLLLPSSSPPGSRPINALPSPLSPAFGPNTPRWPSSPAPWGRTSPPSSSSRRSPTPARAPTPSPHTPRSSRGSSILRAQGSTASLSPPRSPAFYSSRTPSPAPSSSRAPSPAYYATAFSSSAERVGLRAPSPAFPHDQHDQPFPTRVTYDEREDEWLRVPSLPHSHTSTAAHPSTTTRSTRSERFLSRAFEFAEAPSGNWNNGGGRGGVGPGTSTTYRCESRQGWSSEWGGAAQGLGMDEVVNRLRGLNMKRTLRLHC